MIDLLRSPTWCSIQRDSRSSFCVLTESASMLIEAAFMRIGTACMLIGASFVLIAGALCQSQQPLRRPKQFLCQSKQWITSNTVLDMVISSEPTLYLLQDQFLRPLYFRVVSIPYYPLYDFSNVAIKCQVVRDLIDLLLVAKCIVAHH